MRTSRALVLLMVISAVAFPAPAAVAPDWVDSAMKTQVPEAARKGALVYLLDESMVEFSRGARQARVREAARIQTSGGLRFQPLMAGQARGEDFKMAGAWIVKPDGTVKELDRTAIHQMDADSSYSFSMSKVNVLAPEGLRVGDVLAWEYATKVRPEFYGEFRIFGASHAVLRSRLGLKLPSDWKVHQIATQHGEIPGAKDDGGYMVWEMRDIPAPVEEPDMPPYRDLAPTLLVSFGPGLQGPPEFSSWEGVAAWYAAIVEKQLAADDVVRSTAQQVRGPQASAMETIGRVARFVQGVRYLDVAVGRSVAEPHPASLVLRNRYGDCEDKSVITIALLRQLGFEAWPVLANTVSGGELEPGFPMPGLFNHAITAIKLPEGVEAPPASVDAGPLGRLLIFDGTDSLAALGDLSSELQGTRALVAHPTQGSLVTLPVLGPEASARRMEIAASFPGKGGLDVKATVTYTGQYGSFARSYYAEHRGEKGKEALRNSLSSRYGQVEIRSLTLSGMETPGDPVAVSLDLWMPFPGQDLGNLRTMATTFPLRTRADAYPQPKRANPLLLRESWKEESVTLIDLPAAWRVLEPLPASKFSGPLGDYELTSSVAEGKLRIDRTLAVKAAKVAPADYAAAKKFFDDVMKGDSLAVGLEKTPAP